MANSAQRNKQRPRQLERLSTRSCFLLFKFLRSDKSVISHSDFEWIARKCDIGANFLVAGAQLLWENAKSNPKKVWFGFDQLEKTFQLNLLARSNDQILLHEKTVVLLDEAQDCTACQMSWINMISANCKCYAVGDIHQAIYQFRGAKPECFVAFAKSPLPLTQSFRFGRNIAAVANAMIFIKTNADVSRTTPAGDFNIEGVSDCDGTVDISTREDRAPCQVLAFIARSNIKLIERLMKELAAPMESRRRISFQPALQKCMDQLVNLLKFKCGELRVFKDTTTGTMFDSYHELKAAVDEEIQKQDEDIQDDEEHCLRPISRETIRLVTLMEKCGPNTDKLLEACEARPDHTEAFPRLILRTVHGAKGDEWDFVEVADDFTVPVISKEGCRTVVQNAGEINFIYVAVTRAKKVLLLPHLLFALYHQVESMRSSGSSTESTPPAHVDLLIMLGVTPECADCHVLKKAYRQWALKWHPDKWVTNTKEERDHAQAQFIIGNSAESEQGN